MNIEAPDITTTHGEDCDLCVEAGRQLITRLNGSGGVIARTLLGGGYRHTAALLHDGPEHAR